VARLGASGAAWQAALPGVLADLASQWSLQLGRALPGGSASYVVRATTADGGDAVLKVVMPDWMTAPGEDALAAQVRTLRLADGRGYVRLLADDPGRRAMLLEALGPSLDRSGGTPQQQLTALAATLRVAWSVERDDGAGRSRLAVPVAGEDDTATRLAGMVERLWAAHELPCSVPVRDEALRCAARRAAAFDLERCVVVHGDPHPGNALRAPSSATSSTSSTSSTSATSATGHRPGAASGWLLVDPDGFLAEPAYDLGVALRDWSSSLTGPGARATALGYCHLLAAETGVDAAAIWDWGFLERVSTGLYVLDLGSPRLARTYLDSAERLL
jgi:streptomycin 6-kinase